MAYPSTARAVEAELARLAADHPDLCTRTVAPNHSHESRSISFVTISGGGGGGRRALIPAAEVTRIVDRLDLSVLALINPDGRAFSQSAESNAMWRKNRRPRPPRLCAVVHGRRPQPQLRPRLGLRSLLQRRR